MEYFFCKFYREYDFEIIKLSSSFLLRCCAYFIRAKIKGRTKIVNNPLLRTKKSYGYLQLQKDPPPSPLQESVTLSAPELWNVFKKNYSRVNKSKIGGWPKANCNRKKSWHKFILKLKIHKNSLRGTYCFSCTKLMTILVKRETRNKLLDW